MGCKKMMSNVPLFGSSDSCSTSSDSAGGLRKLLACLVSLVLVAGLLPSFAHADVAIESQTQTRSEAASSDANQASAALSETEQETSSVPLENAASSDWGQSASSDSQSEKETDQEKREAADGADASVEQTVEATTSNVAEGQNTSRNTIKESVVASGEDCADEAKGCSSEAVQAIEPLASIPTLQFGKSYGATFSYDRTYEARFTLSQAGCVTIDVSSSAPHLVKLDGNEVSIFNADESHCNKSFYLNKGTYTLSIEPLYWDSGSSVVKVTYDKNQDSFSEPKAGSNQSKSKAASIALGKTYHGTLGYFDDEDWLKFTVPNTGKVTIDCGVGFEVMDQNGNTTGLSTGQWSQILRKGTYYVKLVYNLRPVMYTWGEEYTLKTSFSSSNTSINSKHGTFGSAASISLNKKYSDVLIEAGSGNLCEEYAGYFKFTMSRAGKVTITYPQSISGMTTDVVLYDARKKPIRESLDKRSGKNSKSLSASLSKGSYYLSVSGYGGSGTGKYWVQVASNAAPVITSLAPANKGLSLGWNKVAQAKSYYVLRSTSQKGTYARIAKTSATNYVDAKAPVGQRCYYKIQAVNASGAVLATSASQGKTAGPAAVSLKASKNGSAISLSWGASTKATGYEVYRSTTSNGTYSKVATLKGKTWTDKSSKKNSSYYYKVRPYITVGSAKAYGAFSGVKSVKLKASPSVQYFVHRQTYGWEAKYSKKDGASSGTTGQKKRLEGIYIRLANKPVSGSIQYRTHVQKIGWQGWRNEGQMAGTTGKKLRLEAIQIKLTGEMAKSYDVYYRVHAQKFGWMGWAKNGAQAGTAGYAYRLEAIQIKLVPKGGKAPGSTKNAFRSMPANPSFVYTHQTVTLTGTVMRKWETSVWNGPAAKSRWIYYLELARPIHVYDSFYGSTSTKRIVLYQGRHSSCLGKKVAIRTPLMFWDHPPSDNWSVISNIYIMDGSVVVWKY